MSEIVSEHDQKLLSLDYVGEKDGRHVFRFPDQPLRTLTGDESDLREWRRVRTRYAMAILTGNKAVCPDCGGMKGMCQPENHDGKGACGKRIAPIIIGS